MVSNIFTNTDKRRWWKYEELQGKPKTKAELRLAMPRNHADKFLDYCVLFFTKIYLSIRRIIMSSYIPLVLAFGSFWVSGYLAAIHQSFWSLATVVVGTILSLILGTYLGKE